MDANDRGAAVDHVVFQAGAGCSSRIGGSASCSGRRPAAPSRRTARWFYLDELFPGHGPGAQVARPAGCPRPGESRRFKRRTGGCSTHCENTDGLGAIFPPMIYSVIALRVPGLRARIRRRCSGRCEQLRRAADRGRRPGAGSALRLAGVGHGHRHDLPGRRGRACGRASLDRRGRLAACQGGAAPGRLADPPARASSRPAGISSFTTRSIPTSTIRRWCFWPSSGRRWRATPAVAAAIRRGVDWLLSMQNRDGGWAAYDVDIDNQVLTKLPFADHNAMLDPSCADITARVIELLGTLGYTRRPPVDRPRPGLPLAHPGARRVLVRALGRQLHLRHVAGACKGSAAIGFPMDHPATRKGGRLAGVGPAALGGVGRDVPELRRPGAERHRRADPLADRLGDPGPDRRRHGPQRRRPAAASSTCAETQLADGSWDEDSFTGTGFPRVFYLRLPLLSGVLSR